MASESVSSIRAMQRGTARWLATITFGVLAVAVTLTGGVNLLSPGPMATPHGSVENCSSCHSNIKPGPVGWVHNVFAASDPRKDSEACLTCHKIGSTATNPHSADPKTLERLTKRIEKSKTTGTRVTDRLREIAFPVDKTFSEGVFCQTCHEEHKGEQFDLKSMSDGRCQACHTSKIHDFGNDHPDFGGYPFKRRTRISFDHDNHFNKHFPDQIKKKKWADAVPGGCSGCHKAGPDNQHMGLVGFKQVCTTCHIGQIVGTERPEGPKGITLLTIPGLDVETLEDKGAKVGEWPAESEAELTPFMELLIGTDAKRRKILNAVKDVDLLDLSDQSDETIAAVRALAWEVKDLIHTYSSSKPSAVVDRLSTATGLKVDTDLVAKLVASMPRDVLMSAQRQWLPNLNSEIEARNASTGDDADEADDKDEAKDEDENEDDEEEKDEDEDEEKDEEAKEAEEEPELAVDAETWTEFGGWYRQDYAILYKPRGHKDEFMKAWLDFSGRLFTGKNKNLAASTFSLLTDKNAQGQCIKCHSVDAPGDGTRLVNWKPSQPPLPVGQFTSFSHGPHLSIVGEKGCLTCHKLSPKSKSQETYKQANPLIFDSNFDPVAKNTCANCHKPDAVRQDCLLCHTYHVNQVKTPVPKTKLPNK